MRSELAPLDNAPITVVASRHTSLQATRVVAFGAPFVLVLYYALRGGSYDVVVRQAEAAVIWVAIAAGAATGILPRTRFTTGAAVPLAAIALLAIWSGLSVGWSDSAERTVAEAARCLHYAGVVVLVWSLVDRATWTPAMAGLAAAGVVICAVALGTRLGPGTFGGSDVARILRTKRLDQPLNYWNALATWAGMSLAMALAYSAHARRPGLRALFLATVPPCAAAAYLTYSRGGALGLAIGVLAVVALSRNRWVAALHAFGGGLAAALVILEIRSHREIAEGLGSSGAWSVVAVLVLASGLCAGLALLTHHAKGDLRWRMQQRQGRRTAVAAAVAAIVVAAVVAGAFGGQLWNDFRSHADTTRSLDARVPVTPLSASRYTHWRSALEAFGDHPVLGTGAGTSVFRLNRTLVGADIDTHSLYLEQLAELGLPGLLLTLGFLGGLLALALRARPYVPGLVLGAYVAGIGAFAVFVVRAAVDWMWEVTAVTVFALVAIALAASAGAEPRRGSFSVRAGLVVVAVLACLVQLPGLVSTARIRNSNDSYREGDLSRALSQAGAAVSAEPWAASPYAQRALVLESAGQLGPARRDLQRAIVRARQDFRYQLLLARVEAERGRVTASLQAFQRAQQLRPQGGFTVAPRAN
jgi:O-Antigen ligase